MRRKSRVYFPFVVGGDVAEIAGVMRDGVGSAMNGAERIEVPARVGGVVAAVALLVNVEAVDAGRNSGQIGDDFDAILTRVLKVHGPFRRRAARGVERGHRHRASAMRARGDNELK